MPVVSMAHQPGQNNHNFNLKGETYNMSNLFSMPGGGSKSFYPYKLEQSCRFDQTAPCKTVMAIPAATTNQVWTFSTWLKRGTLGLEMPIWTGFADVNNWTALYITLSDELILYSYMASSQECYITSYNLLRDVGSWYHILLRFDAPNTVAEMWLNGVEVEYNQTTQPSNTVHGVNKASYEHIIGEHGSLGADLDGYLAETIFVDGELKSATDFGAFKNGIWVPIKPVVDQLTVSSDETASFNSWADDGGYAFDTLTASGNDISSAISTSTANGYCGGSHNITAGEVYKVTYNLTFNSGTLRPYLYWGDTKTGVVNGNLPVLKEGLNSVYCHVAT